MVPHRKEQIKDYTSGNYNLIKTLKDSNIITLNNIFLYISLTSL